MWAWPQEGVCGARTGRVRMGEEGYPRTACFPRDPIWAPTSSYLPASLQAVTFRADCSPKSWGWAISRAILPVSTPGGGCSKFLAKWGQEGHPSSGHLDWCRVSAVSSTRCGDSSETVEALRCPTGWHRTQSCRARGRDNWRVGLKTLVRGGGWGPRREPTSAHTCTCTRT